MVDAARAISHFSVKIVTLKGAVTTVARDIRSVSERVRHSAAI